MHATHARLQTTAMTTMLFTRLKRSAIHATGMPNTATVIETIDTSSPSSLSDRFHSVFRYGNIETMTCRST